MNKKRFISALLVVVMVLTSLHLDSIDVKAMTEADNSIVYSYNDTDKTATVTGYNDDSSNPVTSIVIPETVTKDNVSYTVSSIESGALTQDKCSALKEVAVLGDKVEIQKDAFGKAAVDGETTGGFVVWCNAGSTAETYGNSIGATVKYLNVKDIEIQQPVKTYFSGCEPFTITTTIAAKDSATATEDILFTIPKDEMKYLYFIGDDGAATNITNGKITQNSDGTAKVEAQVQVCATKNMDVQKKEVVISVSSRGAVNDATDTYTIYKATSSISQEIRVFKIKKQYDVEKQQNIIQAIGDENAAYIKVTEIPLDELEENGYFSNDTFYVDKDYIFVINGLKDSESEYDNIGSAWRIQSNPVVEYLMTKKLSGTSVSDNEVNVAGIVDENGESFSGIVSNDLMYATNNGTTNLSLFSQNNKLSKDIKVEVCLPAESLVMKLDGDEVNNGAYISGLVQTTYQLSHEFEPSESTDTVTWTSSNPNVASVNEGPSLYLKTAGDTTITCTVNNANSGKRELVKSFRVKSLAKVQYKEIVFAKDDTKQEVITQMNLVTGQKSKIIVCDARDGEIYIAPNTETAANEPCTYTSKNESIASVDSHGNITAGTTVGTTQIEVKSESGKTNVLTVNVYSKVEKIIANTAITVPMGQTRNLSYSFSPVTASEEVEWTSENKAICTAEDYVDDNGNRFVKITGHKANSESVMLTGVTKNSGSNVRINVTVEPPINTEQIILKPDDNMKNITTDADGNTVYNIAKGKSFSIEPVFMNGDRISNDMSKWTVEAGQGACDVKSTGGDKNIIMFEAKTAGKFKVTCTAYGVTPEGKDFEKNSTFYVNVYVPSEAIDIYTNGSNVDEVNVVLGNTAEISAQLNPGDSTDEIRWSTDNDNIELSVNNTKSGDATILTANKVGTTIITATSDSGRFDTVRVNVIIPAETISFIQNGREVNTVYVTANKATTTVSVKVSNEEVTTDKTFTWSINDATSYITIKQNADGTSAEITGLARGTQRITVTAPSGASASIDVNVVVPSTSIELNNTELSIFKGDSPISVFANLGPANTTDIVYWSVDKDGIIDITADDYSSSATRKYIYVQGLETGSVVLTATTVSGLTKSMKINVNSRPMSDTTIADIDDQIYTGSEIKPVVYVSGKSGSLTEGIDYTCTYSNNINVGTATITVNGKGIYAGTETVTFKIVPKDISQAQEKALDAVIYNGNEQKPDIVLSDMIDGQNKILTKDTDYTIEYSDNINVGSAMVKVLGKGNYTGEKYIYFQINPKSLSDSEDIKIDEISAVTYNGTEKIPSIIVRDNQKVLVSGTDYYVNIYDNVNAGTASVTVIGMGNYTGEYSINFTINRKSISKAKITSIANQIYTGKSLNITDFSVTVGGVYLNLGTDYKLSYSNNKYPGKATIKITGIGNYKSTVSKTFIILPTVPTNVKMASNTSNSVKLSWKKVTKASGYYIYAYNTKKNKYEKVATSSSNTVTLKKVASGLTNTYQIYSYVKVGSKIYKSTEGALIEAGTKTKTPSIKKVKSQASNSATVSWKLVTGAEGYQIYYSTSKNGKYKLYGQTSDGLCDVTGLKAKKKYYFKIRTYRTINGKVYYSSYSSVKSAKIKK